MKKLILSLGLLVTLVGCLNTENRLVRTRRGADLAPIHSGAATLWWRTPYRADNQKDNPWNAFVHEKPVDHWCNPWKYDDLRQYGVDVFPRNPKPAPAPKSEPSGTSDNAITERLLFEYEVY